VLAEVMVVIETSPSSAGRRNPTFHAVEEQKILRSIARSPSWTLHIPDSCQRLIPPIRAQEWHRSCIESLVTPV
jgi:hypothetical protein